MLSQSLSVIANLHDASLVTVAHVTWNASDASSLQAGITASLGDTGDEFGGVAVGEGLTVAAANARSCASCTTSEPSHGAASATGLPARPAPPPALGPQRHGRTLNRTGFRGHESFAR